MMVGRLNFVLIATVVAGAVYRLALVVPALTMHEVGSPLDSLHALPPVHAIEVAADRLTLLGSDNESLLSIDRSTWDAVTVSTWDSAAAVFVTVGLDGQPGVALVDDDGNGVVDDRSELGATRSDDQILTPDDPGYAQAKSGDVVAMVLSHGALTATQGAAVITGPTQVRVDMVKENRLVSRIIDLGSYGK